MQSLVIGKTAEIPRPNFAPPGKTPCFEEIQRPYFAAKGQTARRTANLKFFADSAILPITSGRTVLRDGLLADICRGRTPATVFNSRDKLCLLFLPRHSCILHLTMAVLTVLFHQTSNVKPYFCIQFQHDGLCLVRFLLQCINDFPRGNKIVFLLVQVSKVTVD